MVRGQLHYGNKYRSVSYQVCNDNISDLSDKCNLDVVFVKLDNKFEGVHDYETNIIIPKGQIIDEKMKIDNMLFSSPNPLALITFLQGYYKAMLNYCSVEQVKKEMC